MRSLLISSSLAGMGMNTLAIRLAQNPAFHVEGRWPGLVGRSSTLQVSQEVCAPLS